jgi:hypothetical protein
MGDGGDRLETAPPYWLVQALTWPTRVGDWSLARAAFVWAPSLAGPLPRAARDVQYVAEVYHQVRGGAVVFFSDLDGFLDEEGTSWSERRTDVRAALDQLMHGALAVPGLLLLIGRRAHRILADSGHRPTLHGPDEPDSPSGPDGGAEPPSPAWEREAVREAVALQLAIDWPAHIRRVAEERRPAPPPLASAPAASGGGTNTSSPASALTGSTPPTA